MTQADSVLSTPPTNTPKITPVDQARRHLLTVAAGATIAALADVNGAVATIPAPSDPIYAAIANHKAAYAAMMAAFAEHRRAHALADVKVGPFPIEIPSMVEPGATVEASCWWDIERAIPRKEYPDLYQRYLDLLDERRAAREAIIEPLIGDEDEATDEVAGPELEALEAFEKITPVTLAGLLAMVAYAGELYEQNVDVFDRDTPIFTNMATAARALTGVQS
jgi:LmbE family N-acetylglucosaminyl deacetylase